MTVCVCVTLRAPLSGTFLQRKDVVNQCLGFVFEHGCVCVCGDACAEYTGVFFPTYICRLIYLLVQKIVQQEKRRRSKMKLILMCK